MSELFSLFINNFFDLKLDNIKTSTFAIICNGLVAFLTMICIIICLIKKRYTILKRLWIVFDFVGICIIEFWFEMKTDGHISYLILTVGSCFLGLSICMFLPTRQVKISDEKRSLAQFLDRCANSQNSQQCYKKSSLNYDDGGGYKPSKVFSSPIISANNVEFKGQDKNINKKDEEIDFSHIKGILSRLEYYPLKEQDKKSASDLEKAILQAEENGLDKALKQNINEGLGALIKIMAKYSV